MEELDVRLVSTYVTSNISNRHVLCCSHKPVLLLLIFSVIGLTWDIRKQVFFFNTFSFKYFHKYIFIF